MENTEQKRERSEPEEHNSDFTCRICFERVRVENKFKNKSLCKHSFWSDCIAKYIETYKG
ncbi:hypothetical protein PTKIN_Ptkin05aG0185200 [Pterospermum kingtungense]